MEEMVQEKTFSEDWESWKEDEKEFDTATEDDDPLRRTSEHKRSLINRLRGFARGIVGDVIGVFWDIVNVGAYTFLIPLYALVLVPGAIIIQGLRHTLRNFYDALVAALRVPFFLVRKLLHHVVLPPLRWLLESLEAMYNRAWTNSAFATVSFLLLILAALLGAVAYLQLLADGDLTLVVRWLSSLI